MQKLGKEIFVDPKYNIYFGSFRGNLKIKPEGIERIKTIARDAKDSDEVWMRVVQVIAYTKGFRGLGFLEMTRLNQAIKETSDTLEGLLDAVTQTEKKYGKIILSPEGWSSYDKSKAWRDDKKKAVEN